MSRFVLLTMGRLPLLNEAKLVSCRCSYAKSSAVGGTDKEDEDTKPPVPQQVFLINSDKRSMGAVTFDDAQVIAKRRNLRLVKVGEMDSTKRKLETYKLVSLAQVREKSSKDEKVLNVTSSISEHDLGVKLKAVQKWLNGGLQVKVAINKIVPPDEANRVFGIIEKSAAEVKCRAVQKQMIANGKTLKFILQPDKKKVPQKSASSQPQVDEVPKIDPDNS